MSGDRQPLSKPSTTDQTAAKSLRQNPFTSYRDPETGEWQVLLSIGKTATTSAPAQ
jgi:hypothetical protein